MRAGPSRRARVERRGSPASAAASPPLRVLWIVSKMEREWRGGIGRVVAAAARALAERGHEVHLAGRAPDGEPRPIEGVRLHPWPPTRVKARQLPHLVRLQRRLRARVVHFHSALPHGAVIVPFAALRARLGDPALVLTSYTGARAHYPKRLARRALGRADALVAASQWSLERAVAAGALRERCHAVPGGIERVVAAPPAERERVVLCLARLVRSKGVDVLLEAFARAASCRSGWRLELCGEGREAAALRERAARLACAERVRFREAVAGAEKERLLRSAALGVVPSRADNYPGALLELQAHGVATIASAVGAIPEAAEGGRSARLVPPDDAAALAEALGGLMDDPQRRAALAEAALRVSRGRTWPGVAERMEAVYRALLRERSAAPPG